VILLAGIKQQKELDSAEIALIETLITLVPGKPGYNIRPGGIKGLAGDMIRHHYSAVVITIQVTGEELYFDSFDEAAKEMGLQSHEIGGLANKMCKWKRRRCKGGKYFNKYFTARFAIDPRSWNYSCSRTTARSNAPREIWFSWSST